MLFNLKEFEHKIEETFLKKGLKLFLNKKVELIKKTGNGSFSFLIHEKNIGEISVQIRSEKIQNYNCFCGSKNNCEHLAAVLFYLQQESLDLGNFKRSKDKTTTIKSTLSKRSNNKKNKFAGYIRLIKNITKPFITFTKLKSAQVGDIQKKINFEKNGASAFNEEYYFNLALICELPKIPNFNYSDRANAIEALIRNAAMEIEMNFNRGLSENENEAFIEATYYSVRSQQNFRSGMYGFFISLASVIITNKNTTADLKILLKKRKQNKNKIGSINRKNVSELQLSIRDAELANKPFLLKNYESTLELPIALAEMEFHKHNHAKAFKLLELYAEKIKIENINKYLDLIIEVLVYAKKYNSKKYEQKYLLEKFVCGYFIDEKELDRFFELNKFRSKELVALGVIEKIKSESLFFTFEKIAIIFLSQNKFDELVNEIKKEKNKFKLLNEIGIKKFPHYDIEFLTLYTKHFLNAITDAKFPFFQQEMFDLARTYLDLLPLEARENIIKKFKDKLLYEKNMIEYISKLYP
jgi:hypothetical protein